MKLKLTMHLDVPEEIGSSDAEIRQNVFDAIVNKLAISYLMDQLNSVVAVAEAKSQHLIDIHVESGNYYKTWGEVIEKADWSLEKES